MPSNRLSNDYTTEQSIRAAEARTVIFVGVHCRRTDYAHHYKVVSGGTLVDRTFFDAAFDVYRERYNDQQNKVVFLAVSDDPKWMKVAFFIITYLDVHSLHLCCNLTYYFLENIDYGILFRPQN